MAAVRGKATDDGYLSQQIKSYASNAASYLEGYQKDLSDMASKIEAATRKDAITTNGSVSANARLSDSDSDSESDSSSDTDSDSGSSSSSGTDSDTSDSSDDERTRYSHARTKSNGSGFKGKPAATATNGRDTGYYWSAIHNRWEPRESKFSTHTKGASSKQISAQMPDSALKYNAPPSRARLTAIPPVQLDRTQATIYSQQPLRSPRDPSPKKDDRTVRLENVTKRMSLASPRNPPAERRTHDDLQLLRDDDDADARRAKRVKSGVTDRKNVYAKDDYEKPRAKLLFDDEPPVYQRDRRSLENKRRVAATRDRNSERTGNGEESVVTNGHDKSPRKLDSSITRDSRTNGTEHNNSLQVPPVTETSPSLSPQASPPESRNTTPPPQELAIVSPTSGSTIRDHSSFRISTRDEAGTKATVPSRRIGSLIPPPPPPAAGSRPVASRRIPSPPPPPHTPPPPPPPSLRGMRNSYSAPDLNEADEVVAAPPPVREGGTKRISQYGSMTRSGEKGPFRAMNKHNASTSSPSATLPPPPPPLPSEVAKHKDKKGLYEGTYHPLHKKHGTGKYMYPNNDIYEGEWVEDRREGFGTMLFVSGEKYQGVWLNDKREGRGTLTWPNNDSFEGNWMNDKRQGLGVYKSANGTEYRTQWTDDKPATAGVLKEKSGDEYKGECQCIPVGTKIMRYSPFLIIKNGHGSITYATGNRYFGCWNKGVRDSFGVEFRKNGERYYGSWKSDKPHGFGLLIYSDNSQYFGEFERGDPYGKGELRVPNGDTLLGHWQRNTLAKGLHTKNEKAQLGVKWCIMVDPQLLRTTGEIGQLQTFTSQEQFQGHSVGKLMDYFIDLFTWSYSTPLFLKSKKQKQLLSDAMDDVTSFLDYLCASIAPAEPSLEKRKGMRVLFCKYILNAIYPTVLRPMYHHLYKEDDAKLSLKIRSLSDANLAQLGVRDIFQLTYPRPYIGDRKRPDIEEKEREKEAEAEESVSSDLNSSTEGQNPKEGGGDEERREAENGHATNDATISEKSNEESRDDERKRSLDKGSRTINRREERDRKRMVSATLPSRRGGAPSKQPPKTVRAEPDDDERLWRSLRRINSLRRGAPAKTQRGLSMTFKPMSDHSQATSNAETRTEVYGEGVRVFRALSSTPAASKLECVTQVTRAIIQAVDDYWGNDAVDIIDTTMGAAEKLPVFQYIMIKSNVKNLFAEFSFMKDFQALQVFDEANGDLEGKYRLSELEGAMEYLMTLDWGVRDKDGILIPVDVLKQILLSCLRNHDWDDERKVDWLVDILIGLSKRHDSPYTDYIFNDVQRQLINTEHSMRWIKDVFDKCGLEVLLRLRGDAYDYFGIRFVLRFPLYVYSNLAEAVWELKLK